ncbi:putative EKC/KEOPS complex subunit BUD32 [Seiridium cardinale]
MSHSRRTQGDSAQSDEEEIIYRPVHYDGAEILQRYNKGGFHPVLIDDVLDDRFEVLYKLGSGGFGTVWLCWDMKFEKWKAVKVTAADHSAEGREAKIIEHLKDGTSTEELARNHIASPLEQFWVEGPNGRHLCYVLEIYGPTLANWRWMIEDDDVVPTNIRSICQQIVKGLGYLHSKDVCHGDLRPHNILMKLKGLEGLSKEEMVEMLGDAEADDIETVSGQGPGPRAPEYWVLPLSEDWCQKFIVPEIIIIDFGESYLAKSPRETTGTPTPYAAPEILLSGTYALGFGSDLWSLGCTIWEAWEGDPMFPRNNSRGLLRCLEFDLGPLPEPFRSAWRKLKSQEGQVARNKDQEISDISPLTWDIDDLNKRKTQTIDGTGYSDILEAQIARKINIQKGKADRLPPLEELQASPTYLKERYHVKTFADLLRKMLQYSPEKRLKPDSVISHPWFKDATELPLSYSISINVPELTT